MDDNKVNGYDVGAERFGCNQNAGTGRVNIDFQ
jgi:hypothetical protein